MTVKGADPAYLLRAAACCSCSRPMERSLHINLVGLNKRAAWEYPVWDNLLLKPGYEHIPRAVAVLCDGCAAAENLHITRAIEVDNGAVIYHDVNDLEDVFPITEDMLVFT